MPLPDAHSPEILANQAGALVQQLPPGQQAIVIVVHKDLVGAIGFAASPELCIHEQAAIMHLILTQLVEMGKTTRCHGEPQTFDDDKPN